MGSAAVHHVSGCSRFRRHVDWTLPGKEDSFVGAEGATGGGWCWGGVGLAALGPLQPASGPTSLLHSDVEECVCLFAVQTAVAVQGFSLKHW